jgi:hypothetical protein
MNPYLIAALADQSIRDSLDQAARRQAGSPRPARPARHPRGRLELRRRIGITLVETGLRLLASTPPMTPTLPR